MSNEYAMVVLGDALVGKTALITRFCTGEYVDELGCPTIEDSFSQKCVVDGRNCLLKILDTGGLDTYQSFLPQWSRSGNCYMLVYSVTCQNSFRRIKELHSYIQGHLQFESSLPIPHSTPNFSPVLGSDTLRPVPFVIVGCKADRSNERKVATKEGRKLATELGGGFIEVSAKTRMNVEEAFCCVVRTFQQRQEKELQTRWAKVRKMFSC